MSSGTGQSLGADDPRQAGPYRLEARLGQGGTGAVFLGRARSGRAVAVKVIALQLAGDEAFRRRLAQELDVLGRVRGTGLPETVAADPTADRPWVASQYVPGASLAEAVRAAGPLPFDSVRVLGAGLAEALAALHGAGLVHTALQPHKVLLATDGPRLTSFAAVRAFAAADPSRTVNAVDGRFLAPEQARGHHAGPESDIFALAGLLVLALTGRAPFRDGLGTETLRSIIEDDPDLTAVPEPLRSPLAAALAKDPERRPGPEVLVRRFAPSAARAVGWLPPPLAVQAADSAGQHWSRRRALLLAVGGAGVLGVASTATVLLSGSDDASGSKKRSGAKAPGSLVMTPLSTLDLGKSQHGSHIAYSPDGKRLAITLEDRVTVWDATTNRRLSDLAAENAMGSTAVAFGRGGLLALGYNRKFVLPDFDSDLGGITVWDSRGDTRKPIAQLKSPSESKSLQGMTAVAFSPDGRLVAGARNAQGAIGKAQVWDVRSEKKVADLLIGSGMGNRMSAARSLAFSPDGKTLAVGWGVELNGGVTLFRTSDWQQARELPLKETDAFGVTSLAFTPDGRTLAGSFGGLALWDVPVGRLIARVGTANDGNQTLAVSPDGRTVALGGGGHASAGRVALYDLRTRKQRVTVPSGRSGTSDLAFHPDGRTLAGAVTTAKMVSAVQLWTLE
ncbi:protein kinase [Streptomyces sp. NBC_01116]|uniref:protein kinase family protein n=1 Tax=Streptomyces sp. NBC_01116 TaxID=2903752 RepID=UPI0032559793